MNMLMCLIAALLAPAQVAESTAPSALQQRLETELYDWLPQDYDFSQPAGMSLQHALEAFVATDYVAAARHFGTAVAADPNLLPVDTMMGILCGVENKGNNCHAYLDSAVRAAPNDPRTFLQYAGLERNLNHLGSMQALLAMAERLSPAAPFSAPFAKPHRIKLLHIQVALHEALTDWSAGLAAYEELLRMVPDDANYAVGVARMHYRLKQYDAAIALLESPTVQKLDTGAPRVFMASWAHQDGAHALAEQWLSEAIVNEPDSAFLAFSRGALLKELGRYSESAQELERAARLGYKDLTALELERGIVAFASGDHAAAEQHVAHVHTALPENVEVTAFYALALIESPEPVKQALAAQLAERIANRKGATYGDAGTLGWIRYRRGMVDEARQAMGIAMRMPTDNVLYFQAVLLRDDGQSHAALELLTPLLEKPGSFLYRERARQLHAQLSAAPPPAGN